MPKRIHQQKGKVNEIYVLTAYSHPLVSAAVRKFKFKFCKRVLQDLRPFLAESLKELPFPKDAVLCPVPLHFLRRNARGFNQAELIAEEVSTITGLEICKLLTRARHTPPQSTLPARQRLQNLLGAFRLQKNISIPKTYPIFLVDDVASTSATLTECASVLKKAGFKNISALVIARNELGTR